MIRIQKLVKGSEPIGSFAVDCNFYKQRRVNNRYQRYISENVYNLIYNGLVQIGCANGMVALSYKILSLDSFNGYINDGEITLSNIHEYFNTQDGSVEYKFDIGRDTLLETPEISSTVAIDVYDYIIESDSEDNEEKYVQYLSGEAEIDDNTVPRPKEIYHDFGISDGHIKLDSSNKNQGFMSNSEDLYAIISRDRLYAVMGIKRSNEIVNDKLEKMFLADKSDILYEDEIEADTYYPDKNGLLWRPFDLYNFNKKLLNDKAMCHTITFSSHTYDSLLRTWLRTTWGDGIFLEQLAMREYLSLICEIYDSTVFIDNGALRFMAR